MTAADQQALGVVDIVVPEPGEGAHADPAETARRLKAIVVDRLAALVALTVDELLDARYRRYRALGTYTEAELPDRRRRRSAAAWAIACATCSTPVGAPSAARSRRGRATSRRLARRSSECPNRSRTTTAATAERTAAERPRTTPPSTAWPTSCCRP